jgi:hypothetical protein
MVFSNSFKKSFIFKHRPSCMGILSPELKIGSSRDKLLILLIVPGDIIRMRKICTIIGFKIRAHLGVVGYD